MISDVDAASYYPSLMINAGIYPELGGGKGEAFIKTYTDAFHSRIEDKRRMQEIGREISELERLIREKEQNVSPKKQAR